MLDQAVSGFLLDEISIDRASLLSRGPAALSMYGVVKVESLFTPQWIQTLGLLFEDKFEETKQNYGKEILSYNEERWFDNRSINADHFSLFGEKITTSVGSAVLALAATALNRSVAVSEQSYIRRVEPGDTESGHGLKLPFHQDQHILGCPLMNVWIPLTDCGEDAPSLQVVACPQNGTIVNQVSDRNLYAQIGAEISVNWVMRNHAAKLVAPTMRTGDALLFLGTTIHRTYLEPHMTRRRDSLEVRCIPT